MTELAIVNTTFGGNSPGVPVGALLVVRALEQAGISVAFADYQLHEARHKPRPRTMRDFLDRQHAPAIGLSVNCVSLPTVLGAIVDLKAADPDRVVILGGPSAADDPIGLIGTFPIDVVVTGEGEISAPALARVLARHGWRMTSDCRHELLSVPGIAVQGPDGPLVTAPPARLDLAKAPLPAYDRIDFGDYGRRAVILTARGCPFRCGFCSAHSVWQRKVTMRPVAAVIAEMNALAPEVDAFEIWDDTFTLDTERSREMLGQFVRNGPDRPFSAGTRADLLTPEMARAMHDAGCSETFLGLESGSDRMLEIMNKGFDVRTARRAVEIAAATFDVTHTSYLWGLPCETLEEFYDTVMVAGEDSRHPGVKPQMTMFTPLAAAPLTRKFGDTLRFSPQYRHGVTGVRGDRIEHYSELVELITGSPRLFSAFYYCHHDQIAAKAAVVERLIERLRADAEVAR